MDFLKNWFGKDEEEEQKPEQAPQPERPMDDAVKQYLVQKQAQPAQQSTADKYMAAMNDNTDVDSAKSAERWGSLAQGLLGAVNTAYGTGDNASFENRKQGYRDAVKAAEAKKLQKADNVLTADKLSRQDVTRSYEDNDKDPNSKAAKSLRLLIQSKSKGIPAETLENMSYDQLKDAYKVLDSGADKAGNAWQMRPIQNKDGSITMHRINPATGQSQDMGLAMGFAPKQYTDPVTGEIVFTNNSVNGGITERRGTNPTGADPLAQSNTVQPLPGETPANFKARLEAASTGMNKTAALGAEARGDVAQQEAAAESFETASKRWKDLYNKASQEGPLGLGSTGPIMGPLSGTLNRAGVSTGPSSNALNNELTAYGNSYIKQMTGAQMSEGEAARLLSVTPRPGQDPELFASQLKSYKQELDRIVAEKRAKAAKLGNSGSSAAVTQQNAPSPGADGKYPADIEARIQTNMDNYGKDRASVIKAMAKKGIIHE